LAKKVDNNCEDNQTDNVFEKSGATQQSNPKAYGEIASPKQSKEEKFAMTILP